MKNNMFDAFQSRPFLFLWLGEIFTQIPINLLNFFLILVVFNLTKSNTAVSGIVLSFTLPAVFFGIPAGVFIDRWNKKRVLLLANVSRAALLILLSIFHTNIPMIYILSFLITVITQFFIPAESPIIPLIVKDKHLLSANALFSIGIFGSILIAYLLSGPMLLYFGIVKTILLLASMLMVGAFFISLIQVPASEEKKGFGLRNVQVPFPGMLKEISNVLKIIRSSWQVSYSLFLLAISQILVLIIASIAPGYANEVLKIRVEQIPLLVIAPAALGIVIGAFIIANLFHDKKKDAIVTVGIFLSGIILIIMPYGDKLASRDFVKTINLYLPDFVAITNIDIIVMLAFLLGIANSFIFVPSNTIVQEETTDEMRGKIYGVLNTLIGLFSFIPILAVGGLSDLIGVSRVIVGIGCVILCIAIFKLILRRKTPAL